MIVNLNRKVRAAAAVLVMTASFGACNPPSAPVSAGSTSHGALVSQNMADYYYPTQPGWTYVYKQTITEYNNTGNQILSSYTGGYDTLKTLGYQGFLSPQGDSVFAFSVTYRVLQSKNTKDRFQLYYVKKGSSNNGGFIDNNNPTGISGIDSITAVAAAIDTILYAVEGPARDVIDNALATGSRIYRTDKIYFTAKNDVVSIWWYEFGALRQTRLVWEEELTKNTEWQYAQPVGDENTYWSVKDENESISTTDGTFDAAKIQAFTQDLKTSTIEYKWWGANTGLVKQYDEWRVTSDGLNFQKKTKVRELISSSKH